MEQNAVIYLGTLHTREDFESRLELCNNFANQNNFNVVKITADWIDFMEFITSIPNITVIISSYYHFADEPHDIGFINFLEQFGINAISVSETLEDCTDLKILYEKYKREIFTNEYDSKENSLA